jgi:DNA-binding IclR family transcriptional regulator
VLIAIAVKRGGAGLAELSQQLKLPKTSLHRLLNTLEYGGYVIRQAGLYIPGPESFRLARLIGEATPSADFPACARPVLEWLAQTDFLQFTADTTRKDEIPELLRQVRETAVVLDRNGIVDGASGIASPAFDREGEVFCAVSIAGPTDRVAAHRARDEQLILQAGERISRILGYSGTYPPRSQGEAPAD